MYKKLYVGLLASGLFFNATHADGFLETIAELLAIFTQFHKDNIAQHEYLQQLNTDLASLPAASRSDIINLVIKEFKAYDTYLPVKSAHNIAKSAVIQHGEVLARQVAASFYTCPDRIKRQVESQRGNLQAVLRKSTRIDSSKLTSYFGDNLLNKMQQEALHPDNKPYLKTEWHDLLTETSQPQHHHHHATSQQFDPNQRHKMYDDFGSYLRNSGMPENDVSHLKQGFWNECASCHHENAILACMHQYTRGFISGKITQTAQHPTSDFPNNAILKDTVYSLQEKVNDNSYSIATFCKKTQTLIQNEYVRQLEAKAPTYSTYNSCCYCLENYTASRKRVILSCGHTMCRQDYNTWFANHNTCPTCNAVVNGKTLEHLKAQTPA